MDTTDYSTLGYTIRTGAQVKSQRTGLIYTVIGVHVTYVQLQDQFGNTLPWGREDFHEFYEEV